MRLDLSLPRSTLPTFPMSVGIHYHRLEFRDVEAEQFKEVLDRANLEHTIIGGQRGHAEIEQFHGPGFSIDRGNYAFPVIARGQFAPGCLCIGFVKGDQMPTWINGSPTGRGDLQIYYEGADIFYRAGPGGHWVGLTVTRETLQAEARKRLGHELPLASPGAMEHLHTDPQTFDRLTRLIGVLRPGPNGLSLSRRAQAASEWVLGAYVEAIATADPSTKDLVQRRTAHRNEVIRRADAAIRCLIGHAYSSRQLCRRLGMSERNLELYFHEALGVTPKAWFQYLSLHRARTMLQHDAPGRGTVTDVALACGFEHFGRFSAAYRKLFGQCPSEMLRLSAHASMKPA